MEMEMEAERSCCWKLTKTSYSGKVLLSKTELASKRHVREEGYDAWNAHSTCKSSLPESY